MKATRAFAQNLKRRIEELQKLSAPATTIQEPPSEGGLQGKVQVVHFRGLLNSAIEYLQRLTVNAGLWISALKSTNKTGNDFQRTAERSRINQLLVQEDTNITRQLSALKKLCPDPVIAEQINDTSLLTPTQE